MSSITHHNTCHKCILQQGHTHHLVRSPMHITTQVTNAYKKIHPTNMHWSNFKCLKSQLQSHIIISMPHLLLHSHNFVARICDIGFLRLLFFISKKSVILKLQMTIFHCKSQFHCHKLYGIFPYTNLGVTTSTYFDLMEPTATCPAIVTFQPQHLHLM